MNIISQEICNFLAQSLLQKRSQNNIHQGGTTHMLIYKILLPCIDKIYTFTIIAVCLEKLLGIFYNKFKQD